MIEIIQRRLDAYGVTNPVDEGQATKQIIQEVALFALWRAGFFNVAAFQGGTSLRILHGLSRFSEDLDFMLKEPDPAFEWSDYEVCHQDLSSNFALKLHALLCRGFLKGRDWFDFSWYVKQGVSPNLPHLKNALVQYGPWQGRSDLTVDNSWLKTALQSKINEIDWAEAASDVERFLKPVDVQGLSLWSTQFFSAKLNKLL